MASNLNMDDMSLPISGKPIEADLRYCDLGRPRETTTSMGDRKIERRATTGIRNRRQTKFRHGQALKSRNFENFGSYKAHVGAHEGPNQDQHGSSLVYIVDHISSIFHCPTFLPFQIWGGFCKMQTSSPFSIRRCQ